MSAPQTGGPVVVLADTAPVAPGPGGRAGDAGTGSRTDPSAQWDFQLPACYAGITTAGAAHDFVQKRIG